MRTLLTYDPPFAQSKGWLMSTMKGEVRAQAMMTVVDRFLNGSGGLGHTLYYPGAAARMDFTIIISHALELDFKISNLKLDVHCFYPQQIGMHPRQPAGETDPC